MTDTEVSQKIVIGLTGENGSGKDTVSDYLEHEHGARKLVFSDLLKEALEVFIDKIGRSDFAWLSTNLRSRFGDGILAGGMKKKIDTASEQLIVISGVRDFGELDMIKQYKRGYLLYVTADVKVRWERIAHRNVKADDNVSFEQFVKEKEMLPSEQHIKSLSQHADFSIDNSGTREELVSQIDDILHKINLEN